MPSIDNLYGIHATALKLCEQRMSMLASNIANAATPGFKARDIDFSSALQMEEDGQSLEAAIRFRIQAALVYADGVISEAARMLTLKRTTLIEKMRQYRLEKIAA
jgi:flagellar basal-body rod protein FlgB